MKVCLPFDEVPEAYHNIWWLIGNYDGLHKGHQALVAAAKAMGGPVGLLTFEPHPRNYFDPHSPPFRLTPWPYRQKLLEQAGIDIVVVHPFEAPLANMQASDFIDDLILKHCRAQGVVVGEKFRFGFQRQGNIEFLSDRLGANRVKVVSPVLDEQGQSYSSSRVREAVREGHVEIAERLLGRPWSIIGPVGYGMRRGHELGFPTANIDLGDHLCPRLGAYAGLVSFGPLLRAKAAVHIGRRPTLEGDAVHMGVHLLDFDGFLYDQTLTVELTHFIRQEWAFTGVAPLKERIALDVKEVRDWLDGVRPLDPSGSSGG